MQRLSVILFALILFDFSGIALAQETPDGCKDATSPFVVLMYHKITNAEKGARYAITSKAFENQLKWLSESGYKSLSLERAYANLVKGEAIPAKSVMFTFDDSHASDYEIAAPILEKYGFRGVFFIISKNVSPVIFDRYMNMKKKGHEIGSHSYSHPYMTKKNCRRPAECCGRKSGCTPGEISAELLRSKKDLAGLLGKMKAFAWPGNFYDDQTIALAKDAGYDLLFACDKFVRIGKSSYGFPGTTTSPDEIFRLEIDGRVRDIELLKQAIEHQRPLVLDKTDFWKYSVPNYKKHCPDK